MRVGQPAAEEVRDEGHAGRRSRLARSTHGFPRTSAACGAQAANGFSSALGPYTDGTGWSRSRRYTSN
jgi:hypothetical protein